MSSHRFAFQYAIDAICKAAAWVAAVCLLILALMVSYEVVVRYTTGQSSGWIQELSVYLMMTVGYLAAAYALQLKSHFSITFVVDRLPRHYRQMLVNTTNLSGLLYSLIFLFKGADMAHFMYQIGDTSTGLLQTPLWIPASLVPLSGLLLSLQFLSQTIDSFGGEQH